MAERVVIFTFPGVKALDVVAPNDVFTRAAHVTDGGYEVTVGSISGGPVTAESGITFPTKSMPEPETVDTLVLPGGPGVHSVRSNAKAMSWIRTASSRARRTVSIGTGALLAAEAGMLGRCPTPRDSSAAEELDRTTAKSAVDADTAFVRSSATAWTTAAAGGIDTVLTVVWEDFGANVANEVARWLVLYQRGARGPSQFGPRVWTPRARRDAIRQAQATIDADPAAKYSISELARRAAMSPRHFVRKFIRGVGQTPRAYVERARIELARRRLEETNDTVVTIAARCGFGTAETMRRAFARQIGVSPTEYRRSLDRHGRPAAVDGPAGSDPTSLSSP